MRPSFRIVAIVVVIAAGGYFVAHGLALDEASVPAPPPVAVTSIAEPEIAAIEMHALRPRETRDGRNLFAYREPPPKPVAQAVVRYVAPPPVALAEPVAVQPAAPAPTRFTWKYVGSFGPRERPFAVFSRDGEVITARRGERVDAHFVVKAIGVESVDVQPRNEPVQRIPLG
ncbi:MAG TPA: hypothetical protein VGF69_18145 [Thermoanaerobaculia bacterium]|jgi:hypothetical protein